MPIDHVTADLRAEERKQDQAPTIAMRNKYEAQALEEIIDRDELVDALAEMSDGEIGYILNLVITGGDDADLGYLIRKKVERYVRGHQRFAAVVGRLDVEARERDS